ncbi:uncharacterized protein C8Q71DRAFT_775196 [Rhodofomes roseus]|uniref:Uncharacterized protein n=1 Tax=Rhodofomes roseus TaxID=34475 RepID=A0ABQ8K6G0_9APHY|nr:uncharacterized protein C8Q71DRAFT_775196 [Rhodofomes roseus]KAH9832835.1 hypothetical protein C8Q71DRAFT_775196 [Rhodofomes roseus]
MSFLGLRKWPTPVAKPLWPFAIAGAITFALVAKAQDMGVKCAFALCMPCHVSLTAHNPPAETWRNDPRNPYAAQIAKESHH